MAASGETSKNWKTPDEFIRLQRLKQRKKQLAARFHCNNNVNSSNVRNVLLENDKAALLEAKIAQKRKNPFAKIPCSPKKTKTVVAEDSEDSLIGFVSSPDLPQQTFVKETPTRSPPAKLMLQTFDPKAFSKLLHQTSTTTSASEDDEDIEEQNITKHLPMDWCLKTRIRFFCRSELPATQLKTSQMASGLTSFVRCIDTQTEGGSLDISPATRFNQATYYWQHPHIPWMTLFPRNSRENTGIIVGERERNALAEDWDYSFRGLFHLLRARQCAFFYLCANTFTVLFRAAGTSGRAEIHALMTPTTRGMRQALKQEGIEYTMPLKKDCNTSFNKSAEGEDSNSNKTLSCTGSSNLEANDTEIDGEGKGINVEDEDDDDWLENLEVEAKEIRKIETAHQRKMKAQEMSEDFSDNSLVLIEGVECQGFFSFLLNAKSTINTVGRLAGVPPTLLAPVAFPKATMQHLNTRSNKVRMDGVDYFSIEVKGIILPSFLPYVCQLLGETKDTFSATLASSTVTLAFSKATMKLLEDPAGQNPFKNEDEEQKYLQDENEAGEVFGKENLSDCGLQACVVENMCRTGNQAVTLLERVCYDKEYGYAWS